MTITDEELKKWEEEAIARMEYKKHADEIHQMMGKGPYIENNAPKIITLISELRAAREEIKLLEKQSQDRWDKGEALADHNCDLLEENQKIITQWQDDVHEACKIREENKKLREALEFYASGKIGPIFDDETRTSFKIYEQYGPHSIGDVGTRAREALKGEESK